MLCYLTYGNIYNVEHNIQYCSESHVTEVCLASLDTWSAFLKKKITVGVDEIKTLTVPSIHLYSSGVNPEQSLLILDRDLCT